MSKFGLVFLFVLAVCSIGAIVERRAASTEPAEAGPAANQRLTALVGAVLFVLLVAIAVTTLYLPQLLGAHYLVGLLLVPPLALKLTTTGYRFGRYYTGSPPYRRAGPPPALLRWLVAPAIVISAVAVFATGIELWLFGARFGLAWQSLHSLSAVAFILATGAHLLGHLPESLSAARSEGLRTAGRGAFERRSIVIASILLGAVIAAASLLYSSPFHTGLGT